MDDLSYVRGKQRVVYFDVGGTVFRVFQHTIQNYPSSLLAKFIYEFPDLGEEGQPLFVDRNPKAFEWILEIYRNGDLESCIPALPRAVLQRELDFYQLPGFVDLGLSELGCFNQEAVAANKYCGKVLVEALTERKLWKSLPLYVWFYCVRPDFENEYSEDLVWFSEQPSARTEHFWNTHQTSLRLPSSTKMHGTNSTWVTFAEGVPRCWYMIRNPNVPEVFMFLQQSTESYGLRLELPEGYSDVSPPGVLVSIANHNR